MMGIVSTIHASLLQKYMLPEKTRIRASKKMRLKHNLRPKASKMNIVPKLHSTLISVPKMANADYIAVFDKKEA
jgi:hypothetical protein